MITVSIPDLPVSQMIAIASASLFLVICRRTVLQVMKVGLKRVWERLKYMILIGLASAFFHALLYDCDPQNPNVMAAILLVATVAGYAIVLGPPDNSVAGKVMLRRKEK